VSIKRNIGTYRLLRNFIKRYAQINVSMEKLLKKDIKFQWNEECQQRLNTLKENMVTMPILVFVDWEKKFHFHVDALAITLGEILA
jgi:hypothetical protein